MAKTTECVPNLSEERVKTDWLKCNICFNTYNDSIQRPRSLSCGHTFCETCLNATIQNGTLTCPRCRKVHEIISASDLPINFDLEGLLKSLNLPSQDDNENTIPRSINGESDSDDKIDINSSLRSVLDQQERSLSTQKELLKTSAGICHDHPSSELKFRCSLHKCWVCEHCIKYQGDHPKQNCRIITFKEEIDDRKQEHRRHLNDERTSLDETLSIIEKHIIHLNMLRMHHDGLMNCLQDLLNKHKKEDENIQNEIALYQQMLFEGKKKETNLLGIESSILGATTLDESNTARDTVKSKTAEVKHWTDYSQKDITEGKLVLEETAYSLMASILSFKYRVDLTEPSLDWQQELQEIEFGPITKAAKRIKSKDIEFMIKNMNKLIHYNKDELNDVAISMNMSWNCEQIITKVQLILLSLLCKISDVQDHKTNTWAVQTSHNDGLVRAGRLTRSNGRIVLHSLQTYDNLPYMAITLPFERVMQLYNPNSLVFLQINEGLTYKGTVNIEIYDELSRGKGMISFCTGEKGWSFRNISFKTNNINNSFVTIYGFYSFPSSLLQSYEYHESACVEGVITHVYSSKDATPFNDCSFGVELYRDTKRRVNGFGKVVAGLPLIKKLGQENNHISDCGIII